ncbi:MAG: SRPBCC domain-containing protein [Acidobacteriota bacterium]
MKRDLRLSETYPHPPDDVWSALTDSAALADWLMPNDFEPQLGHRFQFRTRPAPGFDGTVNCEVIELDRPRRLAFTWKGGGLDTVVRFTLEPVAEGTRLLLEHTGFRGARAVMVSFILAKGWKKSILPERLPAALRRFSGGRYQPLPESERVCS